MSISAKFKEAVSEKDKISVRIMLKDSLLIDKSFKDFADMSKYALENGLSDLYDGHNGKEFLDESQWTEDYLNEEIVSLFRNFSKERIELLKQIINKVYDIKDSKKNKSEDKLVNSKTIKKIIVGGTKDFLKDCGNGFIGIGKFLKKLGGE